MYLRGSVLQKFFKRTRIVTPSAVQLHTSKLYSSQLPEGFAGTHLLSSCTLLSKLRPGSKTSHFKPWISKRSEIHRHLQHVLKIVTPHQSQRHHYPCRSEVSWSNRSSDNTPSFQTSQENCILYACKSTGI